MSGEPRSTSLLHLLLVTAFWAFQQSVIIDEFLANEMVFIQHLAPALRARMFEHLASIGIEEADRIDPHWFTFSRNLLKRSFSAIIR